MIASTLGHYEIIEPLGASGMGKVYRTRDTARIRNVAIKVLGGAIKTLSGPIRLIGLAQRSPS